MRTLLIIIFSFFLNITISFAESILSDEDSSVLARECSLQHRVQNDYELEYSRWKASIIEINDAGALIKSHIELKYKVKSGGKNGWGNETISLKSDFFTCVFIGVSKGKFNVPPDYSIEHHSKNRRSIHGRFNLCGILFRSSCKSEWKYAPIPMKVDKKVWLLARSKEIFEYKGSYIEIGELPISHPHFD